MKMPIGVTAVLLVAGTCAFAFAALRKPDDRAGAMAKGIVQDTGVRGGLIVHIGCGDGKLTAALCANDSYVVHGLDADARNIAAASGGQ